MKSLLSRPIWRAFILCIPLWIIFSNFLLAAISAILLSFLIGMLLEIFRIQQQKKSADSRPPRS